MAVPRSRSASPRRAAPSARTITRLRPPALGHARSLHADTPPGAAPPDAQELATLVGRARRSGARCADRRSRSPPAPTSMPPAAGCGRRAARTRTARARAAADAHRHRLGRAHRAARQGLGTHWSRSRASARGTQRRTTTSFATGGSTTTLDAGLDAPTRSICSAACRRSVRRRAATRPTPPKACATRSAPSSPRSRSTMSRALGAGAAGDRALQSAQRGRNGADRRLAGAGGAGVRASISRRPGRSASRPPPPSRPTRPASPRPPPRSAS